jgi:hypothetical protein
MSHRSGDNRLSCSEIGVLAMLAGLLVYGLAVSGRTLLESLLALGFGGALVQLAYLWRLTLRRAETAPPLTRGQRVWNAAVFVAFLSVVVGLVWWWAG